MEDTEAALEGLIVITLLSWILLLVFKKSKKGYYNELISGFCMSSVKRECDLLAESCER